MYGKSPPQISVFFVLLPVPNQGCCNQEVGTLELLTHIDVISIPKSVHHLFRLLNSVAYSVRKKHQTPVFLRQCYADALEVVRPGHRTREN